MRYARPAKGAGVERLESRVLLNAPPEKFVVPVAGNEGVEWAITAYTDQDPAPGFARDYRDRQYAYDGSKSINFSLPDFAAMDRGVDVLAAAKGTVVESHDGEFDRVVSVDAPVQPPKPDNYVLIDHGDGWLTRYGRLRNGSVAVSPGQVVTAGQEIGQVGGSGESGPSSYSENNTFLRFEVTHDGEVVEPFLDAEAFWQTPPTFAGDLVGVWYMTSNAARPPNNELFEHLPRRNVFHPGETVVVNTPMHGLNAGRSHANRYFRPDGTQFSDPGVTPADRPFTWRTSSIALGANAPRGVWEVNLEVDGEELARTSFVVADPSQGLPEIKLYQGSTYVIDGRTTPIDFGRVDRGATAPRRSFSIQNFGSRPLTLGQVTLPDGFSVVGTMPTSVPAGSSRTLTIQLDNQIAATRAGRVIIRSDDAQEGEFDFAVRGTVTGVTASVVGRHVFYNNSSFDGGDAAANAADDGAIAAKSGLTRGFATFFNVSGYSRGINGVMIDIRNLPDRGTGGVSADDFDFGTGPVPSSVSVRRGAGIDNSDRVTLIWPDFSPSAPSPGMAVANGVLRVAVKANADTGLSSPHVFSFGNLIGDTGDGDADHNEVSAFRVNALDMAAVRRVLNTDSRVLDRYDFNGDGRVNALDLTIQRANRLRSLAAWPEATVGFAPLGSLLGPGYVILPAAPDADDLIQFTDDIDLGGGNDCDAALVHGSPRMYVDHAARRVRVLFERAGGKGCPDVAAPVRGLAGHFGPLGPGLWQYQVEGMSQPARSFVVSPVGAAVGIAPAGPPALSVERAWDEPQRDLLI